MQATCYLRKAANTIHALGAAFTFTSTKISKKLSLIRLLAYAIALTTSFAAADLLAQQDAAAEPPANTLESDTTEALASELGAEPEPKLESEPEPEPEKVVRNPVALKPLRVTSAIPDRSNFALVLLKEIVKRNGKYKLVYPHDGMGRLTLDKTFSDFEAGDLDLIWTMSSKEYEQRWKAVHYPLYLGMFGMRVPIISRDNPDQFANVKTLNDLKRFKAGQGKNWPDTDILLANGIPTVVVTKYGSHFPMLDGDRFDYFPRAIHEPWGEIKDQSQYNLVVDKHILLRYRAPFYFFVSKTNNALYQYLMDGLEDLAQSGRHKALFFEEKEVRMALSYSELAKRAIIDLKNPELSPKTPVDRPELWYDPLRDKAPY